MSDLLGLSISIGMISRLERQGAIELETPVEEIREHVRAAASANIDETSWWQGRVRVWLWVAVTTTATAFTIASSRVGVHDPILRLRLSFIRTVL